MTTPLNTSDIAQLFAREFDVGSAERIETVTHGYLSTNWIVHTANDSFFLKQYRLPLAENDVRAIHEVIDLFEDQSIPVIKALPARNGNTVVTFNGRLYSLFPFAHGVQRHRKDLTAGEIGALGGMLAAIHRAGAELPHPLHLPLFKGWDRTLFLERANEIRAILNAKTVLDDFDRAAAAAIEYKLSKIFNDFRDPEDFDFSEYAVLHGDFHEHNVFFNDQHAITHVFDWEKTSYGPRGYELVRSMYLTCVSLETMHPEEAFKRAKTFFDAYQNEYPVSEEEFRTALEFYYIDQFYSIWIERLHYHDKIFKADELLAESIARIRFLEEYREEFARRMFNDKTLFSFITS